MKIAQTIPEVRAFRAEHGPAARVAFVPTMGALHDGHLSLVRAARSRCDVVIVSIFVNPTQFGPDEDFESYPRDQQRDLDLLRADGVDVVFVPEVEEMYPPGDGTVVSVGSLATVLEGEERPGHFDGVCTVVAKLFNIVAPHQAFFGQKDAQQVAVIKKMVHDLRFDVDVVVGETVRERDGLALSSRNVYLDADERRRASALFEALRAGAALVGRDDLETIEKTMWEVLVANDLQPGYARAVHPETFAPAGPDGPVLLVVAARAGTTRLIDNLLVER